MLTISVIFLYDKECIWVVEDPIGVEVAGIGPVEIDIDHSSIYTAIAIRLNVPKVVHVEAWKPYEQMPFV
jgi:hypothetical protein